MAVKVKTNRVIRYFLNQNFHVHGQYDLPALLDYEPSIHILYK
jgi:hypothetical protein